MFILNFQKPTPNQNFEPYGEYLLNTHLESLKKSDPHKDNTKHQQVLQSFYSFLNHDERAPGPNKPFLSPRSIKLVSELQALKKLPTHDFDFLHTSAASAGNLRWGKGPGSLLIAAHLTHTKKTVLVKLQEEGKNVARDPDPKLDELHQRFDAIIAPYHKLLHHFLPPEHAAKHQEDLEKEGANLLAQKRDELTQTAVDIGADPQSTKNVLSSIDEQTQTARRFTSSEQYIQHRLKNYERWLRIQRTTGKALGDATVGAGILTFAPPIIIPFVVAGYIGHQLSTININLKKDQKEQHLRDRTHKIGTQLDRLSLQAFGSIPQKLAAHLQKFNFLPQIGKTKKAHSRVPPDPSFSPSSIF